MMVTRLIPDWNDGDDCLRFKAAQNALRADANDIIAGLARA